MAKVIAEGVRIDIPVWVKSLNSFRRWVHSEAFPQEGRISFINGEVWADLSTEELFSHNQVKLAIDLGLGGLIEREDLGLYMPDGMLMTNDRGKLGNEPDAMVVLTETLQAKRVVFRSGKKRGAKATELVGTPDLVVEIVSPSSEDKDTQRLLTAYFDAGIPEYWLIDARQDRLRFEIYKRSAHGYSATRKADGWVKSQLFQRHFHLLRREKSHGVHGYVLEVR